MKTIFLITTLIFAVNINAQIVNIPDASFKAYLVGQPLNSNNDSEIQVGEASVFNGSIDCNYLYISDLTGIEAFTSLTYLDCAWNELTSLDVSQNTALTLLNCSTNPLTSVDVSQNTALTQLVCEGNLLQCLNVKNGNNSNLWYLSAYNNTNLNCIEVDDVAWSTSNWTGDVDAGASFSTNCGNSCSLAGLEELSISPKQLFKMIDLMGRETVFKSNTPIIYLYSDGTTERVFKFE